MIIIVSDPASKEADLLLSEVAVMRALMDRGLTLLHLRKPAVDLTALTALIDLFTWADRARIVLHPPRALFRRPGPDCGLAELLPWMRQMGLRRLHIPAWLRQQRSIKLELSLKALSHAGIALSTGIHTMAELDALDAMGDAPSVYEYILVSPLFDSLSKSGYKADPTAWNAVRNRGRLTCKLVGMGGIEAEKLPAVRNAGFDGAALLGAVWQIKDAEGSPLRQQKILDYFNRCVQIWENTTIK